MLENSQKVVEVMEHSISEKMVYVRFCFLATEKTMIFSDVCTVAISW